MLEDILRIKDVADYLTRRTPCRLAQEGRIPAFKGSASWRFGADTDVSIKAQKLTTAARVRSGKDG